MPKVGVPGMLDGRLLADEGRSAGLTSSPDFFRSIGGFPLRDRSGSSSSLVELSSEPVTGVSGLDRVSTNIADSVFDLA